MYVDKVIEQCSFGSLCWQAYRVVKLCVTLQSTLHHVVEFRKRKRTVSATLPIELRQISIDEDRAPCSPLLGYDPERISNPPPHYDDDKTTRGCDLLVYSNSPRYGNTVLDEPGSSQYEDVFHQDSSVQSTIDVGVTKHQTVGIESDLPTLYDPPQGKSDALQDSGSPPLSAQDSTDSPNSYRDGASQTQHDLVSSRDSGDPFQDNLPPSRDSRQDPHHNLTSETNDRNLSSNTSPHNQPSLPAATATTVSLSLQSDSSLTLEDVEIQVTSSSPSLEDTPEYDPQATTQDDGRTPL